MMTDPAVITECFSEIGFLLKACFSVWAFTITTMLIWAVMDLIRTRNREHAPED